jgi:hypothetical protein
LIFSYLLPNFPQTKGLTSRWHGFRYKQIDFCLHEEVIPLVHWWKCQILNDNTVTIPFLKGDVVFAKNDAERVILFDGRKEVLIPKLAMRNIKLIFRLDKNDTIFIERDYQQKRSASVTWTSRLA